MSILAQQIKEKLKRNNLTPTGTIDLRNKCKSIGYNYWQSLRIANAIDELDSELARRTS